ncbi:hypothetical protein [Vreelandella glaciei]|uniref:hypothetical protein n=1 Tax=Vreelandella glaciei TaxID=186761 RepID=UPI003001F0D1
MNHEKFLSIIYNSDKSDWLFSDEKGVYTYKPDLHVRIERREIDHDFDRFTGEEWATNHPDSTAFKVIYELYYGASFVELILMVSVDGHRATLPLPDRKTLSISERQYKFAKIVDQLGTLDDYLRRAGLKVRA